MKSKIVLLASLICAILLTINYPPQKTFAQTLCQIDASNPRAQGLISAISKTAGTKFSNPQGNCVIDPKAQIKLDQAPAIQIDSYRAMFANYYTRKRNTPGITKDENTTNTIPSPVSGTKLYHRTGDVTIPSLTHSGANTTALVFVDGHLFITGNIDFAQSDQSSGIVLVVQGNIYIHPNVTTINAVLISQGAICTAYDPADPSFSCSSNTVTNSALTVNGSLISLDPANPIRFRRSLLDNTTPAEKINTQAKYLVILKNLLSSTLSIRYEDTSFATNLGAPPLPPVTLTSSPTSGSTNSSVTVSWTNLPNPQTGDVITLHSIGSVDDPSNASYWRWMLTCSMTGIIPPGNPPVSGSCPFVLSSAAGNYEFRIYRGNAGSAAIRTPVTITP